MSAEPVNAWDARLWVTAESNSALGTATTPSATDALEYVTSNLGPNELGVIRPQRDRSLDRAMANAYVEGRVQPIPWTIETSVKSRSSATAAPRELQLYRAAGLACAAGGSNYVVSINNDPMNTSGAFNPITIARLMGQLGATGTVYEGERLRGGLVKSLVWSGGDKELTLVASGVAQRKDHMGYLSSITLDNSQTTYTFADDETGRRFGLGWYIIGSEIIQVTAMDYSTYTMTFLRAQLSTSAASHTAVPMVPYMPAPSVSGSPISEGTTCTCTLDSQAIRVLGWQISFNSGMDASPGETGSKYFQTVTQKRTSATVTLRAMLRRETISLLGKSTGKKTPLALSLVQGSAAGGIATFTLSYCELDAFAVPDTFNDQAICSLTLRTFGLGFSLTLT